MISLVSDSKLHLGSLFDLLVAMANPQYSLEFLFKN